MFDNFVVQICYILIFLPMRSFESIHSFLSCNCLAKMILYFLIQNFILLLAWYHLWGLPIFIFYYLIRFHIIKVDILFFCLLLILHQIILIFNSRHLTVIIIRLGECLNFLLGNLILIYFIYLFIFLMTDMLIYSSSRLPS